MNRPRSSACSTRRSTRSARRRAGLLSEAAARGDRRDQRPGLRPRQQRRVQGRVRALPGGLRRGGHRAVRDAGRAGRAAVTPALPGGRPDHRGRSPPVHDARPLRSGLRRPLQVQPAGGWSTTRTSGRTRASCTSTRASPTTVDFHHIKQHYYGSHETVNPSGIVPKGPIIDWDRAARPGLSRPPGRDRDDGREQPSCSAARAPCDPPAPAAGDARSGRPVRIQRLPRVAATTLPCRVASCCR